MKMNIFVMTTAFVIAAFVYLHLRYHLTYVDDLEVLEIGQLEPGHLDEVCENRVPVVFDGRRHMPVGVEDDSLRVYDAFDVSVRELPLSLGDRGGTPHSLRDTIETFSTDRLGRFISENNDSFLGETGLMRRFREKDLLLRPYGTVRCDYDIVFGSPNSATPLRKHMQCRTVLICTKSTGKVKLTPPRSSRYLSQQSDLELLETRATTDPWEDDGSGKIKYMEIPLQKGMGIVIPAHWWYSINLCGDASFAVFQYTSAMNALAMLPQYVLHLLQKWNVRERTARLLPSGGGLPSYPKELTRYI